MSLTNMSGLPFKKKKFSSETKNQAKNSFIYGVKVKYGSSKKQMILYQSEVDIEMLMLLPRKEQPPNKLDYIDLRDVIDIQEQAPSEEFKSKDCLMIDEKNKKHYFIFTDEAKKNLFWQAIQILIEAAYLSKQENMKVDYVKQMALDLFSRADSDLSDNLTYEEGFNLLKKLNVTISKKDLLNKFKFYDMNQDSLIQIDEFIKIARDILQKSELKPIFKKYTPTFNDSISLNHPIMKKEDFFRFLKIEQKQTELDQKSLDFLDVFFSQKKDLISYNDFVNLVFNYQNNIYEPAKLNLYQSMDQPLTDYFINSSHNTYLMANQLTGDSSIQAYVNAFRKGCRCIEIDAWDGNEPIVTHGFTLTSSIKFRDIIETVYTYGFAWSKYPIIISIENHCNKENQKKMAQIMKEILGSSLYLIPEEYQTMPYYPSPKQLKRKVIVKAKGSLSKIFKDVIPTLDTKKQQSVQSAPSASRRIRDSFLFSNTNQQDQIPLNQIYHLEHAESDNLALRNNEQDNDQQPIQLLQISELKQLKTIQTITDREDLDKDFEDSDDEYTKAQVLQVKDFQRCISMVGISFSFETIRHQTASIFDIFSLSEDKIIKLMNSHESLIINYHKKFFSRIYPKGSRVNSSNYDPFPAFSSGSQIIALNFQTCDYPLFMYLSKFQQNGGIYNGYVLKPRFLRHYHPDNIDRSDHKLCNSLENKQIANFHQLPSHLTQPIKEIKITIISGQCLKREEDDSKSFSPFVEVALKGTEADERANKIQKTKAIANNTFHPVFNSAPLVFKTACPQLAMISFQVFSSGILKDELFAQYALDFECIREGYRVVPLWDKELQKIEHGMLLVHIEITNHNI